MHKMNTSRDQENTKRREIQGVQNSSSPYIASGMCRTGGRRERKIFPLHPRSDVLGEAICFFAFHPKAKTVQWVFSRLLFFSRLPPSPFFFLLFSHSFSQFLVLPSSLSILFLFLFSFFRSQLWRGVRKCIEFSEQQSWWRRTTSAWR